MKYKEETFLVAYMSKEYRDNWEKIFGKKEKKRKCNLKDKRRVSGSVDDFFDDINIDDDICE
jgi:hypothetical protein